MVNDPRRVNAKPRLSGHDLDLHTTPEALAGKILENLSFAQGRLPEIATKYDWYFAIALTVRSFMLRRWIATAQAILHRGVRVVGYLSAEFLPGRHLENNLINLGILDEMRAAVSSLGLNFEEILAEEEEPGLGNGGLGRLASCFLDSLATLEIPAIGYGIRYEFGIFDQAIRDGAQVELADEWLLNGNPWEIVRPDIAFDVGFGGRTEWYCDQQGRNRKRWLPERSIRGVAYDTPVSGFKVNTVDILRLWRAEALKAFDLAAFNLGDYFDAVEEKIASENVSKVLYPNDQSVQGRRLRLEQQYFFVSCSLRDMLRIHSLRGGEPATLPDTFAVQLNDTHPSIAIAELMRLLIDVHGMDWAPAWDVTRRTLSYTNHTLLPEALETWPLRLFGSVLPRHLEIIYEIDHRFLAEVRSRYLGDEARMARMSLIDKAGEGHVRMAHLAVVGSHTVHGVSRLHTELLAQKALRDFNEFEPDKLINVTNGVTPRRWMLLSNPDLAKLITDAIGERWLRHAEEELAGLEPLANDASFLQEWRQVKQRNKERFGRFITQHAAIALDPLSMFDVQVKRIHEYKRQHLNVLHVITLYNRLRGNQAVDMTPRTVIFGGKAAPGLQWRS